MNQRLTLRLIFGVCAVLLVIGMFFSIRVTHGMSRAAHQEAVDQSPVPTPAALLPAKAQVKATSHG